MKIVYNPSNLQKDLFAIQSEPSPKDFIASVELGRNVTLRDILLVESSSQIKDLSKSLNKNIALSGEIEILCGKYDLLPKRTLVVYSGANVTLFTEVGKSRKRKDLASIQAVFGAVYFHPKPPIPDVVLKKGIPAFAQINGPYTAWPYIRQEIQGMSLRLGLGFTLPIYKVKPPSPLKKIDAK